MNNTVYLSGQIPLVPETQALAEGILQLRFTRYLKSTRSLPSSRWGPKDIVKLNVFLTDLSNFPVVNEVMAEYFSAPYPARAAIGVKKRIT